MANVRMPDGTVIKNVPPGVTQEDLLEQYSQLKAARSQPSKYEVSEDTIYSPEGIPLYQPSSQAEMPAGVKTAERILTDIAGAPVRAAMGVVKPIAGAMEFAGVKAPSQAVNLIDAGMKQQTGPISTGASFLGDIGGGLGAVKALKAVPGTAGLASRFQQLSPLKQTAVGGAGLGLTMPTGKTYGDEGFFAAKAEEAGLGAAAGVALHKLLGGAANLLAPQLERLKQLKAQGIDTDKFIKEGTLGQILGGGVQTMERFMQAVPFGGMGAKIQQGKTAIKDLERQQLDKMRAALKAEKSAVKENRARTNMRLDQEKDAAVEALSGKTSAEKQAIIDRQAAEMADMEVRHGGFSTPIIGKVLDPIESLGIVKDAKLPEGLKGHEAIKYAQKKVSEAYDAAIKDLGTVHTDAEVNKAITQLSDQLNDPISGLADPNMIKKLDATITHLKDTMENMEGISGSKWHEIFKKLGQEAYDLSSKDAKAAGYYRNLQKAWGELGANSDTTGRIRTINEAFQVLQPVERAAIKPSAAAESGEFGPKELLSSAIAESSTNRAARGEAILQPEAQKALAAMKKEAADLKARQAAELKAFEEEQALLSEKNRADQAAIKDSIRAKKLENDLAADKKMDTLETKHAVGEEKLKEAVEPVVGTPMNQSESWLYRAGLVAPLLYKARNALFNPEMEMIPGALQYAMGEGFVPTAMTLAAPIMTRAYGMAQPALKAAATAERPSVVRKAGENIRDYLRTQAPEVAATSLPAIQQPSEEEQNIAPPYAHGGLVHLATGGHATAAWQRKEGQNPEGGLNAAGRASYHAETGGTLKPPVSAKEAKSSPKKAARRKSFCARMTGMPGPMKDESGKPTRKALALRKWDC